MRGAPSAALKAGEQSDIFRAIPQTRSVVVSLNGIYFDTDRHVPQSRSMSDLTRLADLILQNARQRYTVVGYADARGSSEHNLELSKRRADWIRNWLIDQGVPPDQISAVGKGAVSDGSKKSPSNLQKNRRVDLGCNPQA
ncbi:MAG: OmpA family protein [Bacteroidota bacterium]